MLSAYDMMPRKLDITASGIATDLLTMAVMIGKKKSMEMERKQIAFYFGINNRASWSHS